MNAIRTPLFYMANLGSEVSRAFLEYQREDFEKMSNSIIRAKGIMEKIGEFSEMKGRTGELEILRSIIENLNQKKLEINTEHLINYFTPFAARLMLKGKRGQEPFQVLRGMIVSSHAENTQN